MHFNQQLFCHKCHVTDITWWCNEFRLSYWPPMNPYFNEFLWHLTDIVALNITNSIINSINQNLKSVIRYKMSLSVRINIILLYYYSILDYRRFLWHIPDIRNQKSPTSPAGDHLFPSRLKLIFFILIILYYHYIEILLFS